MLVCNFMYDQRRQRRKTCTERIEQTKKNLESRFSVAARCYCCCQINCCISDISICDFLLLVRVVYPIETLFADEFVLPRDGEACHLNLFTLIKCRSFQQTVFRLNVLHFTKIEFSFLLPFL